MDHSLIYIVLLFVAAALIIRQDMKERLISLWVIISYLIVCAVYAWYFQGFYGLLSNLISVLLYMLFTFVVIKLVYFLKERKSEVIIDSKIGMADVLLFFSVGLTLDVVSLIVFSVVLFVLSAVLGLIIKSFRQSMPFGAVLVLFHCVYMLIDYTN